MRTLNLRFLAILVVVVSIAGVSVYFIHDYQVTNSAEALLREAEQAKAEDKPLESIGFLQRYVSLVPKNAEVLAQLGLEQAEAELYQSAFFTLDKALRLGSELTADRRREVRMKLIEISIAFRNFQEAMDNLAELSKEDEVDAEVFHLRARCLALQEELQPAFDDYMKTIAMEPERTAAYAEFAEVLLLLDEELTLPEEREKFETHLEERYGIKTFRIAATRVLDEMVENNPEDSEAYLARCRWLLRGLNDEQLYKALNLNADSATTARDEVLNLAAEDAKRARELAPDETDNTLLAAEIARQQGQFDSARKMLAEFRERFPELANAYLQSAAVELTQAQTSEEDALQFQEAAIECLEQGVTALPDNEEIRWTLTGILIDTNQLDKANTQIEILQDDPEISESRINYLQGRIQLSQSNWMPAIEKLDAARDGLVDFPDLSKRADTFLGDCYRAIGRNELSLQAYRRATALDADWLPARVGAANALAILPGRMDEASAEYDAIGRIPNVPSFTTAKLRLLFFKTLRQPEERRNWSGLKKLIAQELEAAPDAEDLRILNAEVLAVEGNTAKARTDLQDARDRTPKTQRFQLALIALAQREAQRDDNWTEVERLLAELEEQFGDTVDVRTARVRYLVARGQDGVPAQLRKLSIPLDSYSVDDVVRLATGIANLAASIEEYELASELCAKVASMEPKNLGIRLLMFDLAFRSKQLERMEQLLQEVKVLDGRGPLWRYGQAVWLAVKAENEDTTEKDKDSLFSTALAHLEAAREERPRWSQLAVLTGAIHDNRQEFESASRYYVEAIENGERTPEIISRAIYLLQSQRQLDVANRLLKKLKGERIVFPGELSRLGSTVSAQQADFSTALQFAQDAADKSDAPEDIIWLGQVHYLLKENEKAKEKLKYAISKKPEGSEGWMALVQVLELIGEHKEALATIAEARQAINEEDRTLAIAQCYALVGDVETAKRLYKEAVDTAAPESKLDAVTEAARFYLQSNQSESAEAELRSIISQVDLKTGKDETENERLSWARRNLALLIGPRISQADYDEAMRLIEQNLNQQPDSVPDLRVKGVILSNRNRGTQKAQAIAIFESILADPKSVTDDDRFTLARLYLQTAPPDNLDDDNWAMARSLLSQIVANNSQNLRFLRVYIQALIAAQSHSEASIYLRKLRELDPDSRTTVELQALLLYEQKDFKELKKLLDAAEQQAQQTSTSEVTNAQWNASLFEAFSRRLSSDNQETLAKTFMDKAETLYDAHFLANKDAALFQARFYARSGKPDKALTAISQNWELFEITEVAQTLGSILISTSTDPDLQRQLDHLLDAIIQAKQEPVEILVLKADLAGWMQQYEKAETLYRTVLKKDPNNIVALNNCAILIGVAFEDRHAEALSEIKKVITLVGNHPEILDSRAMIYLAADRPEEALRDLMDSIRESAPDAIRQFHIAQANLALGRTKEAREAFQTARKLGLGPQLLQPFERERYAELERKFR